MNTNGDSPVFILEFRDIDGVPTYVWSHEENVIHIFMNQHNMSIDKVDVRVSTLEECASTYDPLLTDTDELQPYKFKSNSSKDVITLYTTENILSELITYICDVFTRTILKFGEAVTREDVELFDRIVELIDSLPYACVYEFQLLDDPRLNCGYINGGYIDRSEDLEHEDYSITYDNLIPRPVDKVQPITIEAYVHFFVRNTVIPYKERGW